jgi:hypothetical protein
MRQPFSMNVAQGVVLTTTPGMADGSTFRTGKDVADSVLADEVEEDEEGRSFVSGAVAGETLLALALDLTPVFLPEGEGVVLVCVADAADAEAGRVVGANVSLDRVLAAGGEGGVGLVAVLATRVAVVCTICVAKTPPGRERLVEDEDEDADEEEEDKEVDVGSACESVAA